MASVTVLFFDADGLIVGKTDCAEEVASRQANAAAAAHTVLPKASAVGVTRDSHRWDFELEALVER